MWHPGRQMRWARLADRILRRSDGIRTWSDGELRDRARDLRWEAQCGASPRSQLVEFFALAIDATDRELQLRHYPVQIMGALALFDGCIAEMQTGEGKTITAVPTVALRALAGRGVHVVTANEYLAQRDAEMLAPVYERLDLSVGCIVANMSDDDRRDAYQRDITYGTASEFGFDFLRDRLKGGADAANDHRRPVFGPQSSSGAVQRGHHCAIVDEADSILIDEACTPLIIGLEQKHRPSNVALYRWADRAIEQLVPGRDFEFEANRRQSHLTEDGSRKVALMTKPVTLDTFDAERIFQQVETSLNARLGYARDRDYVIVDGDVAIVDEGTGRILDGRKWQDGLHQAVEAKEGVWVTPVTTAAARVAVQTLFRRYQHLSGMTGTASASARELRRVYGCPVTVIPTHRPCRRSRRTSRVFVTLDAKYRAVADEVDRLLNEGRAVLIGTPSVTASTALSNLLRDRKIAHVVLNAIRHAEEADIVAAAGQPGRVTIATNMAGRGTDIKLDETVARNGGLHVIATEMHSAARIDRQLVGRAARQGDPGSYQFLLSLEDELLRALPSTQRERIRQKAQPDRSGELPGRRLSIFRRTQRQLERLHAKQRKLLLRSEKQRLQRFDKMGLDPQLELVDA